MGCSQTHTLKTLDNFEKCEKHFQSMNPLRSGKWSINERPIKTDSSRARFHHYRIVADWDGYSNTYEPAFYDVLLYNTVMARFHRPVGNERRVQYMGHDSSTSRGFMWRVLSIQEYNVRETTYNTLVAVPVYSKYMIGQADKFSADLMFVDGLLDKGRSDHVPHAKRVSSGEDKQQRAAVRATFAPFVMLACTRLQEFHDKAEVSIDAGRPFAYNPANHWRYTQSVQVIATVPANAYTAYTAEHAASFFEGCQRVYDGAVSRRKYKSWSGAYNDFNGSVIEPISEADFTKAIMTWVLQATGLSTKKSAKQAIEQFPLVRDYPKSNIIF